MYKRVVLMLLSCFPVVSLASEPAVKETNYSLSASYTTMSSSDPITVNGYGVMGMSRFALGDHTGMQLSGSVYRGYTEWDSLQFESTSSLVGASFFARDYDLGSVNMDFSYGGGQGYSSGNGYTDTSYQLVSLSGTYYLGQFDLGAGLYQVSYSNSWTDLDNSSNIGASYYATDNLSLGATVSGRDSSGDRTLHVIFQPSVFNNQWSITGLVSKGDTSDTSYLFLVGYYFDTKVSLIDRNRKY